MIVDCFTFFNELDILELRLTLLDGVVDRFVLCEAPFTFRGDPKPLVYAANKDRFARWNDRIVHLVYDVVPDPNPWENEWGQRAHLTSALADVPADALVLIGDVDEIPNPEYAGRRPNPGRVLAHRHLLSVGYVNRVTSEPWIGTKAVARGDLGARTLNDIRTLPPGSFDIIDTGWHFSALGGASVMALKMHAYSHVEADIPYLTDTRRLAVHFDSEWDARWVSMVDAFPPLLREPRWAPFVWAAPAYERDVADRLMHVHGCFAYVPEAAGNVGALARASHTVWQQVGAERFGAAFAGAFETAGELLAAVPPGGWAIVDELGPWSPADLAALAAHGLNLVAYVTNARSFPAMKAAIEGARFPAGPARGLPEIEAALAGATLRIERRDDVMASVFAPSVFEQTEPLDAAVPPFRFTGTSRNAMYHFSVAAYVFKLRSGGRRRSEAP